MNALDPDGFPLRGTPDGCPKASAEEHRDGLEALASRAALPWRKRAFLAAKVAGYSYDEIAAELDVSWLTVGRQLVRARAALRQARAGNPG